MGQRHRMHPPPKNIMERVIGTNCNYEVRISKGKNRSGLSKVSQTLIVRRTANILYLKNTPQPDLVGLSLYLASSAHCILMYRLLI